MNSFSKTILPLTFLAIMACSGNEDPAPAQTALRKYDIKSGTIYFETDYAGLKGTKVVYFDDYGAKERVESFEEGVLASTLMSDGATRYSLDEANKIAFIVDQQGERGWEMEFHTWEEIQDFPGYAEDYKKVDNITVAGKDCEAFEYGGIAIFAGWKGLTLYHKQAPEILIEAVQLEENVNHDAAIFTVPAGFTVMEMP